MKNKITPYLWFDKNAEEAMNFYTSVFPDAKIISIERYPEGPLEGVMKGFEGKVLNGIFELFGQQFVALDGGPYFKFNESVSFYVECEDQKEVDYYWEKLSAVPDSEQCGWLKDKYGLSWQIIPKALPRLINDPDREKSKRVMDAMLKMKKIDVAELERVAENK